VGAVEATVFDSVVDRHVGQTQGEQLPTSDISLLPDSRLGDLFVYS
jgi:hypothetical protein